MRTFSRKATLPLSALLALGLAAPAAAAGPPKPFDVKATIATCAGESLTIATEIAPSSSSAEDRTARRAVRAVRGARLKLRLEAAPLYGAMRSRTVDLGRTTSARRFERFGDLPAQTYSGVVRYRWVRGSRTVLSGLVRTRKARVAGRRGKAFCSLRVGKRPVDTRAPLIFPLPSDSAWKRGPLNVYLFAVDDLSGVALVVSRVDSGPFTRGRNVQIATEGAHRLAYVARDAAGNQSVPAAVTLRVDMNPPTEPAITAPSGPTTDTTPDIRWDAATDSASGVQRYVALVRNSSGTIVWSQFAAAADPRAVTVGQTLSPGQYTAEVYAVDGATPQPFTSKSVSSFAVVGATAPTSDSDGDGRADSADNCPFAANPDQADNEADGSGDVCDTDDDNDGAADGSDNCPTTDNANQADNDTDGAGDACDADDDNDGDLDGSDNCATVANPAQENFDGDAQGDACDADDDNDGVTDVAEGQRSPPTNPKDTDTDDDGVPDGTDQCPADSGPGPLGRDAQGCPRV
jgi:hypothetical protein